MIEFSILGDYELNQCVELDNIIKSYWIAVNKSDTDNLDCYIYPIRDVDDVEAIPVPINLNGNPRIRYNDDDSEYILYNLSDALSELELSYGDKFLVGFIPNIYSLGTNRFIKGVEYGSGATMMSIPPSYSSTPTPIYSPLVFDTSILGSYNTGDHGEIIHTYASGNITNSELRQISGYEDGIVLDTEYTNIYFNSMLYSKTSVVNNAGNSNHIGVFSSGTTETWNNVTSSSIGTGTYSAEVSYVSGKSKTYGILGFALPCYIISSDSCIPLVCVNRKLHYVSTEIPTTQSTEEFQVWFRYLDTVNTLASPINININYHVTLYDSDNNIVSKTHYKARIPLGAEDNTNLSDQVYKYSWGDATKAKVVIDSINSPEQTDDFILGYKHKFQWAEKKIEGVEFYWHSTNPISVQDAYYESNDIILYHTKADVESIGGLSNQVIPSSGIKLDWDLTTSTYLEGYASDDNQGGDDPSHKFLFYRITKDIINNSTAIKNGVIPFTSEYTQMLPNSLSSGKYYINLFYETSYIVFDGSISSANSSLIEPSLKLTMFSPTSSTPAGITITAKVKQYDSSGNVVSTTDRPVLCQNSNQVNLESVDWVDNAVSAKVIYESSGAIDNIYSKYVLYGYPEDLTTSVTRPQLGDIIVKVPSWITALGTARIALVDISNNTTSYPTNSTIALRNMYVNSTSQTIDIDESHVGYKVTVRYSRSGSTVPPTNIYVRYRPVKKSTGVASSWSSWYTFSESSSSALFTVTSAGFSENDVQLQISDSKSVSDEF